MSNDFLRDFATKSKQVGISRRKQAHQELGMTFAASGFSRGQNNGADKENLHY
jgi:hypothetical protein